MPKLVIPSEIKISPLNFKIRWNDRYLLVRGCSGEMLLADETIRIPHWLSPEFTFYHLIHEGLHAIRRLHGLELEAKEDEEREVTDLSTGITDFLLSLGIEPDFSKILEEEKK